MLQAKSLNLALRLEQIKDKNIDPLRREYR